MTEPLPNAGETPASNKLSRPAMVIIIMAVVVTFGRLISAEFTDWDDNFVISRNTLLNPPTAKSVMSYWTAIGPRAPMGIYCPMAYTVWGVLARAAYLETPDPSGIRLNPAVFHAANLLIHLVTSLAAFAILWRVFRHDFAALLGALFYALHPVMVEPVAWISGMKDLLAGMFSLLSLLAFLQFRDERKPHWYALAVVLFLAAIFSKATAIVLPVLIFLFDRFLLKTDWRRSAIALAPWLVASVAIGYIARISQIVNHAHVAPLSMRPLIAGDTLAFYVGKILFPLKLAIDYGRRPDIVMHQQSVWFLWLIPVALLFGAWLLRKRSMIPLVGVIWLMLSVGPVLGLSRFEFQYYSGVADHYLYLALFGVGLIVAWLAVQGGRGVIVGIVAVLAVRSLALAAVWQNSEQLHRHCLTVNPNSPASLINLSVIHAQRGDYPTAIEYSRRVTELTPQNTGAYENIAINYLRLGDLQNGIDWTRKAMLKRLSLPKKQRFVTTNSKVWLGKQFMNTYGRLDIATTVLGAALEDSPRDPEAKQAGRELLAKLAATSQSATRPATLPTTRSE